MATKSEELKDTNRKLLKALDQCDQLLERVQDDIRRFRQDNDPASR